MFIVLLKFSDNRDKAGQFMDGHNEWLMRGFDDGVFLVAGSLQEGIGGGIAAHNSSLQELQSRLEEDPFVENKVVKPVIHEITPAKVDERVNFLMV